MYYYLLLNKYKADLTVYVLNLHKNGSQLKYI